MAITYASPLDATTTATEPLAGDLSQGIPMESEVNPLIEELERPAMEMEAEQETQQADFIKERAKTLHNNLIDPSTIEYDFSRTSDPEGAKKQALAMAYVRLQNGGQPIPGGKVGYQITRDRIAKAKFNGAGAGDDKAFFDQIQAEAVKNKERFELAQKVQEEAVTNTFREVFDPIRSRQDVKPWKDQLAELRKSPGYEPGNEFRYLEIANEVRQDIIQSTEKHRDKYFQIWTAISSNKDNDAYSIARDAYESFETPEERKELLNTLTTIASTLPEERKAGFWNNFTRQTSRDFTDMGRNITKLGSEVDPSYFRNPEMTAKESVLAAKEDSLIRKEQKKNEEKDIARSNFAEDVQQIRRQNFAPVKRQWGEGIMGDIEAGIYAMPGAIGSTLTAAVPYVGQVATYKMMEGGAYSQMRQQLIAQGVDEEKASSTAKGVAPLIGIIQYIPERFGAKAVTRQIPWLEKIHTGISNKITNRIMRGVISGAVVGAVELSTEVFQDQVPNVMQDVVAELDATIPGTDWEQEMDGFWSQTITTAVAILPLAMMGAAGGVNQEARVRAFAEMPSRVRLAYGITPEADAAIEAAKQQGPESLNQAVEAAQLSRDPRSETAMDAVQEIAEEMNAAAQAAQELEKSTLFPLVNYDTQSKVYTLIDKNTNEEIGQADTAEKAVRLAAAWNQSIELDESDYLTYLVTTLEGAAESATLDADQTYPELNQRKTSYTFDLARTYTAEEAIQESASNAERVIQQLNLKETAESGEQPITNVVFGQSVTDPQSLARKFRETTNRLYRGASVLTVFHEETHGFWREAISTGRIQRSEAVDLFKALDTLAAKQNLKSGESARYLKENFDSLSEAEQETAIDEAISELMEAEILRTRKGGGVRTTSKGLVSRNLAAIARLTGDKTAGKFKAFIDAIRAFFGITMDRALVLKRGIKEGTIDKAGYESFLNRLYGLTEQADFDRFQQEAEKGIMEEIEFDEEAAILEDFPDGNPFSIGRATITPTAKTIKVFRAVPNDVKLNALRARDWVSPSKEYAINHGESRFGENEYKIIEQSVSPDHLWWDGKDAREWGFDDGKTYAQLDDSLKLLDPVTRDESGNIIPLSQRFNPADERISYSIGQSRLADLLAEDAYRRIKNPEVRAKALSKISRELARLRTEAEKLEVMMGSKRLTKSLRREAAMRQAMRFEELENQALARHQGILSDDEIAILTSYPIHGALIREEKQPYKDKDGRTRTRTVKKGRLMSRTQAASRHPDMFSRDNAGEYDGSDGMSPVIYGGSNMPDTVAQDLYDQGLISDPTPDALWQALRAEQNTVGKMKEALAAAKEDLRAARSTSISEAREWLASQVNIQENTYSQKEEILRASALLDAILAALPAQLRGQIGGYTPLARLGSNDSRLSFLRDRLDRSDRLLEKYLRKQFDREFRLLLDRARPEKDEAGKRPKGKLGSNVHELFDDIRDAMNLDATEVEALVASLDVLATNPDNSPEQQAHATLASNLVSLAGNWRNADAARMEIALKEAQEIYNKGYGEAMIEAKRKAERRQDARSIFRTATDSDGHRMDRVRKAAKENTRRNLPKQFLQSLYSFEQVAQLAFGKNLKELKSLLEWERRASNAKHDAITNKTQKLEQLFADLAGGKYKGEKLRWEMSQPGTIKAIDGFGVEQTFSVLEAITATMLWRQEDGRRHMEGHKNENGQITGSWNWTDAAMDQIENQLDGNARLVRMHLTEEYGAEYERLNAIYKSLYGVSLPQHKFYSPITVKPVQAQAGQTIDPVTGSLSSGNMMSPGSLKTRSQSAIAEPDFRDALHTYIAHTMQMEHWMAYAPFAIEAQAIFGNRELRNSIEASAGKETLNILSSWLDYFAQGGTRDAAAHLGLTQSMNRALGRAASVALVGRVSVLVIQSTQLLAGAHSMPMGSFVTRLAKLLTGQLQWKAALKSDYIKRRLEQMPPVVRQSMEALAYAKPSKLKFLTQKMGQTIVGADALFTGGTYAIAYDYHFTQAKKDGASDAQAEVIAHREAEASTDRVAQPTKAATRSLLEVTSTNPFMRLAWSFASEPRQKLALSAFAFSSETTVGEKARALFVTWIAGGVVSSLIRAAIADLRHDEDDEWFDERNWDAKRLAIQSLTGPMAGIPIIGDSIEAAAFKLAGVFMPEGNLFSMGQKGLESATKVPQWFTGERDLMDAIGDAEKMISGAGIFSGNAAAAASLSHVVVDAFKVIDNLIDED